MGINSGFQADAERGAHTPGLLMAAMGAALIAALYLDSRKTVPGLGASDV
jgi:hypothetical protein